MRSTRRCGQLGGAQCRLEVGGERVVRAEVAGQEDEVVAGTEQLRAQRGRVPRAVGSGCVASHSWPGATSLSVISVSTVPAGAQPGEVALTASAASVEEVVAGHERRRRGRDGAAGVAEVGVEHPGDLGGGLDQAADGEVRDREGCRVERQVDRRRRTRPGRGRSSRGGWPRRRCRCGPAARSRTRARAGSGPG